MQGSSEGPKRRQSGVVAMFCGIVVGLLVLTAWPLNGQAQVVDSVVGDITSPVGELIGGGDSTAAAEAERQRQAAAQQAAAQAVTRQEAADPTTEPPLHGTNPHGQGTVAVIDVAPESGRPQGGDTAGSDSNEEIVVGRSRGEQNEDGSYRGRITIAALFGTEILGVDTNPGETETGPLNAVQEGILTPLCDGSGNQICISAARADSSTDENGSTNRFSAARVTLGGAEGIDAGVAESNGNISDDGTCQTAHGDSSVADVRAGGGPVAEVAKSSTDSRACKGGEQTQTNQSSVIALGGTGVPVPAEGCADGTPDTVVEIPLLLTIVCNGDDTNGTQAAAPYGVREALAVFLVNAGGSSLTKNTTAASESRAQAPPAQCSDGDDNDGDGVADANDPGCLSGPGGTYDPNDDDESDAGTRGGPQEDNGGGDDGPGSGAGPGGAAGGPGGDAPECSDRADNDGDGRVDRSDPGCLSGPGGTYDPNDDSEADARRELGSLAMTGSDSLLVAIAGLFVLAAGLELRRRVRRLGGLA